MTPSVLDRRTYRKPSSAAPYATLETVDVFLILVSAMLAIGKYPSDRTFTPFTTPSSYMFSHRAKMHVAVDPRSRVANLYPIVRLISSATSPLIRYFNCSHQDRRPSPAGSRSFSVSHPRSLAFLEFPLCLTRQKNKRTLYWTGADWIWITTTLVLGMRNIPEHADVAFILYCRGAFALDCLLVAFCVGSATGRERGRAVGLWQRNEMYTMMKFKTTSLQTHRQGIQQKRR